jgi:hypothetical protein
VEKSNYLAGLGSESSTAENPSGPSGSSDSPAPSSPIPIPPLALPGQGSHGCPPPSQLPPSPTLTSSTDVGENPTAVSQADIRKKLSWTNRRRRQRQEGQSAHGQKKIRSTTSLKHSKPLVIKVAYAIENLPVASGAFVGVRFLGGRRRPWTMEELLKKGFDIVKWDGMFVISCCSTTSKTDTKT